MNRQLVAAARLVDDVVLGQSGNFSATGGSYD